MNWSFNIYFVVFVILSLSVTAKTFNPRKPVKPEKFRNAEQLRRYLRDLKAYYAVIGRPR